MPASNPKDAYFGSLVQLTIKVPLALLKGKILNIETKCYDK